MSNRQQRIFLLGATGVGKTVIGRGLARSLGFRFYDIDSMIAQRSGVDIPWIVEVEGMQGVHVREQKILTELEQQHGIVVATGSHIVEVADNRQLLARAGIVVYLRACCTQRLQRLHKRYQGVDDAQAQADLLDEEKQLSPYYAELADVIIDTDDLTYQTVTNQLARQLTTSPSQWISS